MGIIHRRATPQQGEYRWQDVPLHVYGSENSKGASRQTLIGMDENAPHFHMRYFAVQAGGHTSLDQHDHDHGVYMLHGRARVQLGTDMHEVNAGDVIYIPGGEVHQFVALDDEPFGFLCVVPAKR